MRKEIRYIFKILTIFCALSVLFGLIWFPQTEGRAENLDLIGIYSDPFIIFIYLGSLPFFIGLKQYYILMDLDFTDKLYLQKAIIYLKSIKLVSLILICEIAISLIYIRFFLRGEDSAGPTMIGTIAISIFTIIVITSAYFQKKFSKM